MAHELPKLPYAHNALEPHIDAQTMGCAQDGVAWLERYFLIV